MSLSSSSYGSPCASADLAIAVGGVDNKDTTTRDDDEVDESYSNYGPRDSDGDGDLMDELKPEVVAPGTHIASALYSPFLQTGAGYTNNSGTSMACPFVAGVVACMLQANPGLTPADIDYLLTESAEAHGEPYDPELSDKYNQHWGFGYVDAYLAVNMALGGNGSVIDERVTCSITSPKSNAEVRGIINITGITTIEEGAVDEVVVRVDNGTEMQAEMVGDTFDEWYLAFDTSSLEPGRHNVSAVARAGIRESPADVVWIDVLGPSGGGGGDDDDDDGLLPFPGHAALLALPSALFLYRRRAR
ncbi:MAG: S8 family serine peptidase [Thermoplasmata archaeon]|nr:S8 family serine peptidase [Thermoplasmata archaeon]